MWVIAILASLAGLVVLILCIPIEAKLGVDTSGRAKFRLSLTWFFGLISKELSRAKKKPEKKQNVIDKATEGIKKTFKKLFDR